MKISGKKLLELSNYQQSDLFDDVEKAALVYADAITYSDQDVSDKMFAELQRHFDDNSIVQLTEVIAWENASSKFNRALRIPSQGLWKPEIE